MSLYKFKFWDANLGEHDEWYGTFKPELDGARCPHCASHPLIIREFYQVVSGNKKYRFCPACEELIDIDTPVLACHGDDLTVVEMKEATTVPLTVTDEDLSSVAKGLKNSKNQKVRITFDEQDMEVPVVTPPTYAELAKDAIFVDLDIIEKLLEVIDYIDYEKLKRALIVLVQNIFSNEDFSIEEKVKERLLKIEPKIYKYLKTLEDSDKKIGYFDAIFELIADRLA